MERMREPPFYFYDNNRLCPRYWNIIFYGTSFVPSFDQANSFLASIGFSFPSHTSRTSLLTPTVNIHVLGLLVVIHENEEVVVTPSRTMANRIQKMPRVEGSTQNTKESANSTDSPI
ncbi:hypothetical protein J1N35_043957 [Gossypium stocksii]|uniref:Uncharacterized protein n=1 Tax=Gossypium stocksii TaxID=47602 RepID=A0A9D3U881_9ROSI|nr:hypothetical protein J1N35_043957 [Gossypium stocksii]